MDQLFKSVFNNIVLFNLIFKHVRIYKKNELVVFYDSVEMLKYKERDYISKILYAGYGMLVKGDLPIGGVLKEVTFISSKLSSIKDAIPYGVEIINFGTENASYPAISCDYQSLPSTVYKLADVVINPNDIIPSNIKSIKFCHPCPSISYTSSTSIKIPNTIKELIFPKRWDNNEIGICKDDIPFGIERLGFGRYSGMLSNLPLSIKHLKLDISVGQNDDIYKTFKFLPLSLESFSLLSYINITPLLELNKNTSITSFEYKSNSRYGSSISPNSLPPNLTYLKLKGIESLTEKKCIPNSVKYLSLSFHAPSDNILSKNVIPKNVTSLTINKSISSTGILPSSLTHLTTTCYTLDGITKTLSILPKALKSLTLPIYYKDKFDNTKISSLINVDFKNK